MYDNTEDWQRAASTRYRQVRNLNLRVIIAHARAGRLDPHWRDALHLPPVAVRGHEMYSDADQLAIAELKDYPEAPWEPHRGRSWRHSLDAWYTAARGALHEHHSLIAEA